MNAWKPAGLSAALTAVLMLAGCGKSNDRLLQGWVEAELIFISPDQQGRVETLSVAPSERTTSWLSDFITGPRGHAAAQ